MSTTDNFRRQHVELLELMSSVEHLLDPAKLATEAPQIRHSLSALFGKLAVHLAAEDGSLYPRCQKHADPQVRAIATKFAREMESAKPTVEAFAHKWTDHEIIAKGAEFCSHAKHLFGILRDRIAREDKDFYPLVDKAG